MTTSTDELARAFREVTGRRAEGGWAAPGRVNLIGEHTDYNEGFVLPFALPQRVQVAAAPRVDRRWRVTSLNLGETATFDGADLEPGMSGWQGYVAGVVWALQEWGGSDVAGADLVLTSNVPTGAGLSSSAALECAVLCALVDLNDLTVPLLDRAKLARRCENEFVGAPTGLMDQAASTLCTEEHALLLDCRSLEFHQVRLDLASAGLDLLVVDTRTPHALVDSEYADRRVSCETASRRLGVPALRDITDLDAALSQLPDPVMRRRVRHVVTENTRVQQAAAVLMDNRLGDLGALLDASQESMRLDFEITVPTVDLAVATARRAGAVGARMTGGGFGGCIIALCPRDLSAQIAEEIYHAFDHAGYRPPAHFLPHPAAGATRIA
ncbi:MAG TPA: galactokinase [Propionibacteriaceae bacterium]|nr:galactokinase [Propionibacteriaceae bacterium]